MQNHLAYLFPAFTIRYTGKEINIIDNTGISFTEKLRTSEILLGLPLNEFDIKQNDYLEDELRNQVLAYIFSTSFSELVKTQYPQPAYLSGFSMGLYAALYHAEAVDYETGLQLIFDVYHQLKKIMGHLNYGMFSVIGFSRNDLENTISELKTTEIVIQNGEFSFVISGANSELSPLIQTLNEQGAVHLNTFHVSVPYHSKILLPHKDAFEEIVKKYRIAKPSIPLVSMIDNSIIDTTDKVENEIINNIIHPLNFMENMLYMLQLGVKEFIELGAGTSLLKSSKFIDGDFSFKAISKHKLL